MSQDNQIVTLAPESTISKFDSFTDLSQMEAFANTLLKSRILPDAYKTPESIMATVIYGKELGISAMVSLQNINFISGKPTLNVHLLQSLGRRAGIDSITVKDMAPVYNAEGSLLDYETVIRFYRYSPVLQKVIEEDVTFTWNDAVAMKLTGKDNWVKMPKEMLYSRCYSKGIRRVKPEAVSGLYETYEMADAVNAKVEVTEEGHVTIIQ